MENVRYQFEFEISEKDYIDLNLYVVDIQSHRGRWIFGVINTLVFLLVFFVRGSWFSYFLLVTLGVLIVLCFSGVWMPWIVNASIRRMKKEGKLPYGKNYLLQFQEDFIFEIEDETETRNPYTKIEKVRINKDVMYIFVSAVQAHIIPLSVFETEEQQNEFMIFIKHKAGIS